MDFARVSLDEKVKVTVPIELKGTPKGEADGGVLQQIIASLRSSAWCWRSPRSSGTTWRRWSWTMCCTSRTWSLPPGVQVLQDGELIVATVKEIQEAGRRPRSSRPRRRRARSHRPQGRREARKRAEARPPRGGSQGEEEEVDSGRVVQLRVARSAALATGDYATGSHEADRRPWQSRSRVCRHPAQHRVRGRRSPWPGGWAGSAAADEFDRLARTKFDGLTLDGTMSLASAASEKLLLLKPMTYMNLSGRAVQAAMAFYQLPPADLMVVLDDLALPGGKLRMRPGGSSGGHNGLKDIERALGTSQYPRLRIGIDAPPPRMPRRDYVLGRFTAEQRQAVDAGHRPGGAATVDVDRKRHRGGDEPVQRCGEVGVASCSCEKEPPWQLGTHNCSIQTIRCGGCRGRACAKVPGRFGSNMAEK